MTSTTANIDYINTSFEFTTLTKIHDVPTYELLKKIKNELKTNATKVQCDLGGGAHGHLGLLLSDAEYTALTTTTYARPTHPGTFTPGSGDTNYQITVKREDHKEKIRLYRECNAVEQALLKQLTEALPVLYLCSYRDTVSNKITTPIRDILSDLMTTYGAVSSDELETQEQELRARVLDITQPMIHLYLAVEDLQELATASLAPYTDKQLVNIGLRLVKNMLFMEKARESWQTKLPVDQTWVNFKAHFTVEWNKLRRLRGPTMRDSSFQNQANLLKEEVMAAMQQERAAMMQEVKTCNDAVLQALSVVPTTVPSPVSTKPEVAETVVTDTSSITQSVNKVDSDTVQLQILKLLQSMDKKLNAPNNTDPCPDNNPRLQKKRKYSDGNSKRTIINKYCWTHGACGHSSNQCYHRKTGHKPTATFKNKLGGSTAFCQFVKDS